MKPPKKLTAAQSGWSDWLLEDWMAAIQIAHAEMDNVDFSWGAEDKVADAWSHIETMLASINAANAKMHGVTESQRRSSKTFSCNRVWDGFGGKDA